MFLVIALVTSQACNFSISIRKTKPKPTGPSMEVLNQYDAEEALKGLGFNLVQDSNCNPFNCSKLQETHIGIECFLLFENSFTMERALCIVSLKEKYANNHDAQRNLMKRVIAKLFPKAKEKEIENIISSVPHEIPNKLRLADWEVSTVTLTSRGYTSYFFKLRPFTSDYNA